MEKIERSDKRLFGEHHAVLAVGLKQEEKEALIEIAQEQLKNLKVIFGSKKDLNLKLKDIFAFEDKHGVDEEFSVPKTLIMSGFRESELLDFMKAIRKRIIEIKLLAVLTPTSNEWKLKELLAELIMEAKAMEKRKKG